MATFAEVLISAGRRTSLNPGTTPVADATTYGDLNLIQLVEFAKEAGRKLTNTRQWPEFEREYLFDLVEAQESYPLPADFNYMIFDTLWNRDESWPLIGPVDATQWQQIKSGMISIFPFQRYRVKGWNVDTTPENRIFIDPVPDAADAGEEVVLEYHSTNWLRPATMWTSGAVVALNAYVYYGMNVYKCVGDGTTDDVAPTHQVGRWTEAGGVQWEAVHYVQCLDTDVVLFQNIENLIDQIVWRWKREKTLNYAEVRADNERDMATTESNLKSARIVNFARRGKLLPLIGGGNIPDGDWDL